MFRVRIEIFLEINVEFKKMIKLLFHAPNNNNILLIFFCFTQSQQNKGCQQLQEGTQTV